MKTLNFVATLLLVVGGLNWGLVGAAGFDLVAAIFGMEFGEKSVLSSLVYVLVGLAAVFQTLSWMLAPARPLASRSRSAA
jgi:uncharacterized membrane protein YuzA (DUF378 family)